MPLMDEVAQHDLNEDQQQYKQQKEEAEAAHRKEVADNFVLQRRRAVGNLLQVSNDIASRIDDPLEATQVTGEFFERVADMFADGQQVAENFVSQAGANQAQVRELEGRTHELEEELRTVQGNQDDLLRSAERASDLRIELGEARRELSRLQREVATLTDENTSLHSELDRVNSAKDAAVESSNAWQSRSEAAELQLNDANARITELTRERDRALDEATHWHDTAVSLGYTKPVDADDGFEAPAQDPPAAPTGIQPAVEEPASGEEPQTRLIDPVNGAFNGTTPEAPAPDEPRQRRRGRRERGSERRTERRSLRSRRNPPTAQPNDTEGDQA